MPDYAMFNELFLFIHFFPGIGTRNYYRKIGYELDGPYMSKCLN